VAVGRKIEDESEAERCLSAVRRSGLSAGEWGRAHGVDGRSLHAWQMNVERRSEAPRPKRRKAKPAWPACHGSAYEIRVRSAKRIHLGSTKRIHLRSAKGIQLAPGPGAPKECGDRPSGSTVDRAPDPALDGVGRGRGRSRRRRPGRRDERSEDGHASPARAGTAYLLAAPRPDERRAACSTAPRRRPTWRSAKERNCGESSTA
jgi:hypothetical protein